MRLLLDTDILLWATGDTDRLTGRAIALIEDEGNTILFSAASIWELAIKAGLQRENFHAVPGHVLAAAKAVGFVELPMLSSIALGVATLPHHHRDPFDRFIVAQAIAEPAMLVTADRILTRYSDLVTFVGRQSS